MPEPNASEGKFCTFCGQELYQKPMGRFNANTGKPFTEAACPNPKCEKGCLNNGGHFFGWFSNTCKQCGYVEYTTYLGI